MFILYYFITFIIFNRKNLGLVLLLVCASFFLGGCGSGGDEDALAKWSGKWKSCSSLVEKDAMKEAYEEIAKDKSGYTADGVKGFFTSMYYSNFDSLEVNGNVITYSLKSGDKTVLTSSDYYFVETVPVPGMERATWHEFKAISGKGAKYLIMTPIHQDKPGSMKHWHFRYGDDSFEALINNPDFWFPTAVASSLQVSKVADDMLNEAEELREMLPGFSPWKGRWVGLNSFLDRAEMIPVYTKIASVASDKDEKRDYTSDEVKAFFEKMYGADFKSAKVTDDSIVFYKDDSFTTELKDMEIDLVDGLFPIEGFAGWFWSGFKNSGNSSFVLATKVHQDSPGSMKHWHIRQGVAGYDGLLHPSNVMWYPTLAAEDTTATVFADDQLAEAEDLAGFFLTGVADK